MTRVLLNEASRSMLKDYPLGIGLNSAPDHQPAVSLWRRGGQLL